MILNALRLLKWVYFGAKKTHKLPFCDFSQTHAAEGDSRNSFYSIPCTFVDFDGHGGCKRYDFGIE